MEDKLIRVTYIDKSGDEVATTVVVREIEGDTWHCDRSDAERVEIQTTTFTDLRVVYDTAEREAFENAFKSAVDSDEAERFILQLDERIQGFVRDHDTITPEFITDKLSARIAEM